MGMLLYMQLAPFLREGWSPSEIQIDIDPRRYSMPKKKRDAYRDYKKSQPERFRSDKPKFSLVRQPSLTLTDAPHLDLQVAQTRFSEVQFFKDRVAGVTAERDEYVVLAREREILFPNAFCLHLIVVTSDGFLLLVHRSARLAYNANVWSLSIEEQLASEDINSSTSRQMFSKWAHRLLHEELGLTEDDVKDTEIRALSVFLEGDVLNCAIAAVAFLPLDSRSLDTVIRAGHSPDKEFDDWRYVREDELLGELLHPTRAYHTTAPYRMLVFLASRSSFQTLVRRIVSVDRVPVSEVKSGA